MVSSKWPPGGYIGFFSGLKFKFGFEYQPQTSLAQYLCIWVEVFWFSVTSFSKWPPGGHIWFFGFWALQAAWFPERKSSLLWYFHFKFHMRVDNGHRQRPIDFQWYHVQNGHLAATLDFFVVFRLLTLGWLWIWTRNFSGPILVYMGSRLLIFSDVIINTATWWPYWFFGFWTL